MKKLWFIMFVGLLLGQAAAIPQTAEQTAENYGLDEFYKLPVVSPKFLHYEHTINLNTLARELFDVTILFFATREPQEIDLSTISFEPERTHPLFEYTPPFEAFYYSLMFPFPENSQHLLDSMAGTSHKRF